MSSPAAATTATTAGTGRGAAPPRLLLGVLLVVIPLVRLVVVGVVLALVICPVVRVGPRVSSTAAGSPATSTLASLVRGAAIGEGVLLADQLLEVRRASVRGGRVSNGGGGGLDWGNSVRGSPRGVA